MSEPIVVGTDGSGESDRAVEWAAAEAVLRRRPLRIVHAVESWPFKVPLFAPPEKAERLARVGNALLEEAAARVRERWPDLETSTALLAEETPDALRQQSEDAFELVLGSRGRGGFASLLLGSTSLWVASRSTVPVVIVRGDVTDRGEVVAGVDLRRGTDAVLDYAFDAAAVRGARLRIVHAWQMPTTLIDAGYTAEEEEGAGRELRERMAAACDPHRRGHPQVEVADEVVLKHPVTALTGPSRDARLIVAGAHERRWNAPRLGSTGHGVIHHAQCPVAMVPPR
ncbi:MULTISPECIES: universal stress protein [unclassified Spirillospora]|uniref:universal stress protein n=1 Tax=unclassified Spirillospora TaxID=2642701 RepID=UPI00371BC1C0